MNNLFEGCFDEAAIKARFRELCKQYHPDLGGSHDAMIAVMTAYEERLRGEFRKSMSNEEADDCVDLEREVAAKVSEVIGLQGLIVELVGRWIWVTGDTWAHRLTLKGASFWWASQKRAWYWHKPEDKATSHGKKSLEEIRGKYGSKVLRDSFFDSWRYAFVRQRHNVQRGPISLREHRQFNAWPFLSPWPSTQLAVAPGGDDLLSCRIQP